MRKLLLDVVGTEVQRLVQDRLSRSSESLTIHMSFAYPREVGRHLQHCSTGDDPFRMRSRTLPVPIPVTCCNAPTPAVPEAR
jgi:hypothetical protein